MIREDSNIETRRIPGRTSLEVGFHLDAGERGYESTSGESQIAKADHRDVGCVF